MADTGAPWNIPFAEPADLVRDWPGLSEDVADAVAAGLSAAGNAGIGSNVVQTVKTNTFTTTSTTFVNVTGLSVTITPSSSSSLILVILDIAMQTLSEDDQASFTRLAVGNTPLYVGDVEGSRVPALASSVTFPSAPTNRYPQTRTGVFLHNPETTSPVTYNAQTRASEGTALINRSRGDDNNVRTGRYASSITAIEVAA